MNLEAFMNPYIFFTMIMAVLVFYTQWFEYPVSTLKPLPGPRTWSILGNLPQLLVSWFDIDAFHEELRKLYGAVVGYRIYGRNVVVVSDVELVREAAESPEFCGRMRDELHENLAEDPNVGILTSYGQTWKEQHDVLLQFAKEYQLEEICTKEAFKIVKVLDDHNGDDILIHQHSVKALTSIFCQVIFGTVLGDEEALVQELVDVVLERQKVTPSAVRHLLPSYVNNLPGGGAKRRRQLDVRFVDAVKKLAGDQTNHAACSTPCFVMRYRQESQEKIRNMETGSMTSLTTHNRLWACIDLVTVCVDQASLLLSQSLLLLSSHPKVQSKLQEDIHLDGKRRDDPLTYLGAVQLETRRLAQPDDAWSMSLMAQSDVTLGEFEIPQGAVVVANGRYLRQGEDKGSDAPTQFRPGRFLEADGSLVELPQMISFPAGKRVCPAEMMSSSASSILIRIICQRFKLSLPAKTPHPCDANGIIQRRSLFKTKLRAVPL